MLSSDLKARTREHHDRAEALPAMQAVVSPDLTRDVYRDHLVRLLGFFGPVEKALAHVDGLSGWLPDLDARLVKTGWLRSDLDDLGGGTRPPEAPAPSWSLAEAFGALYVIEGSTLGGRIISRELKRSVGVTSEHGGRFYASYGDERGDRWTAYKAALDQYAERHPEAVDAVVHAAGDTFDAFGDWLQISLEAGGVRA